MQPQLTASLALLAAMDCDQDWPTESPLVSRTPSGPVLIKLPSLIYSEFVSVGRALCCRPVISVFWLPVWSCRCGVLLFTSGRQCLFVCILYFDKIGIILNVLCICWMLKLNFLPDWSHETNFCWFSRVGHLGFFVCILVFFVVLGAGMSACDCACACSLSGGGYVSVGSNTLNTSDIISICLPPSLPFPLFIHVYFSLFYFGSSFWSFFNVIRRPMLKKKKDQILKHHSLFLFILLLLTTVDAHRLETSQESNLESLILPLQSSKTWVALQKKV